MKTSSPISASEATCSCKIGQFRALSQIDVSRRLNLAELTVFSTSLAGEADPDPRFQSLRGFSPSGKAPSVQARIQRNGWTSVATVPFPGGFSIPLTNEARNTASFEFEDTPNNPRWVIELGRMF